MMYDNGEGVSQDYSQAVAWYRKAAEQGFAIAQYRLGKMYGSGRGVPQDYGQAVAWFQKAAEQGDAEAQALLGGMYATGQGVPQDDRQALVWIQKAAEQGGALGQTLLGSMYDNGEGVPQDYGQAVFWYRKGCRAGFRPSPVQPRNLVRQRQGRTPRRCSSRSLVPEGCGTRRRQSPNPPREPGTLSARAYPKMMFKAMPGLNLAATQGDDKAKNLRDSIRQRMTREQIAEGQKLSRELAARIAGQEEATP